MARRVVITGLGAVSGFGYGVQPLWDALLAARSALRPITAFDPAGFPCRFAAEAVGFAARDHVPKHYRKAVKVMARDIELAVGAAKAAIEDAGVVTPAVAPDAQPTYAPQRVGCQIGAGLIAAEIDELTAALVTATDDRGFFDYDRWGSPGMENLTPLWLLKYLPNMLACHVTILHNAQGPSNTITCSEASGLLSIGESTRVIERGDADLCFSGGAESKLNGMGMVRMVFADRMARTEGDPRSDSAPPAASNDDEAPGARFVRPFDPRSPGGLLGEGGGIIVLESLDTARARGARIYAEVAGFGAGQSSWFSDEDAADRPIGLRYAIENALEDAGIGPDAIDAIVPHACGARASDAEEAAALRAVFGARLADIPLVTITPNIGDTMAGQGGLAACVAALCIHHRTLPARIHAGEPAPGLQAGRTGQRDARLDHVLVCTNALGGQNAAAVFRSPT